MTRAVIEGEKARIEEQPTDIGGMIYIKMSGDSLIPIIYINAVLRIGKRKYYTLPK